MCSATDTLLRPADSVGIGCGQGGRGDYSDDLRYTYENDSQFAAFPTFPGVIMGGGRAAPKNKQAATSTEPEPPRPALNGVKVNVDYERYMLKLKEVPPTGADYSRARGCTASTSAAAASSRRTSARSSARTARSTTRS